MSWIADAYAKINLGLHVLERLPTGYHKIETGFCFIDWRDRFEVEQSDVMKLELTDSSIPNDERNLIVQSINTLDRYIGLKNRYHFKVDKQIPVGAGLGGGSSDAALTLRILNKLENMGLSDDELIDLSRELGADVPFFIKGETAIGSGIGHDLSFVDIQPDLWIITCYPKIESSTPEAYSHCIPNPEPEFALKKVLTETPVEEWRYMLTNDLEQAVFPRHHIVGNLKDQLYEFGAIYAGMSGSGSAVFGLFEQDFVATNAYHGLMELEFPVKITKPGFQPDVGIYQRN